LFRKKRSDTRGKNVDSAIVLLSGGIDSSSCAHLLRQTMTVSCLHVDFGQAAAAAERRASKAITEYLQCELRVLDFPEIGRFGAGEVLGRNAFLVAVSLMTSRIRSGVIALGIHAGTPYFDCSESFYRQIDRLVSEQTDGRFRVLAPFLDWTKKDIFDYFERARLPVAATYSCEAGTEPVCGECSSCLDRKLLLF
jgi:7-cyano-7-deazaguanine synthase